MEKFQTNTYSLFYYVGKVCDMLLIRVDRVSINSVFLRCLCNLNARFTPLCTNITLTPHLCEFCRY